MNLTRLIQGLHEQRRRIADAIGVFERLQKENGRSAESSERVQVAERRLPSRETAGPFRRQSVAQGN
jgi:hypothetical protein